MKKDHFNCFKTGRYLKTHTRFVFFLFLLMSSTVMFAQRRQVTGTVTDPYGDPLIGVSVLEEGTTNGTVTDFDGNFRLNVAADALLSNLPAGRPF